MLINRCKKIQQIAGSKGDDQNGCAHMQQEENGDSVGEQGDQNSDDNGKCSDIENQKTLPVPLSSNTSSDQLPGSKNNNTGCRCTEINKATSLTHTGSQIILGGDKSGMSLSGSS
jgi:ionotropic glutamate receptor